MALDKLSYSVVVLVAELDPIPMTEGDTLRLRVEVLRRGVGTPSYFARVWRVESYRVQPTFPQRDSAPVSDAVDEQILVRDDFVAGEVSGDSPDAVLSEVVDRISRRFL